MSNFFCNKISKDFDEVADPTAARIFSLNWNTVNFPSQNIPIGSRELRRKFQKPLIFI